MKEVLFEIGPFTIYGYGFMVALGVLAAFLVGMYREKKYEIGDDQIFSLGLWCLVCGWGAAKVLFIITELPTLFENPKYFRQRFCGLRGIDRRGSYRVCVLPGEEASVSSIF